MPDVAIVIVDRLCSSAIHHVGDCVQWEVDKGWTSDDAVAAAADTSAPAVPSGLPSRGQASRWVHREACRFSDEHRRLLSRFTSSEELPSVLCGKTLLKHSLDRRIQLPDPIVNDRDLSQFQFSRWFDLLVIMKTSRRQQPWIGLPNKRDRKVPTTVKPCHPTPSDAIAIAIATWSSPRRRLTGSKRCKRARSQRAHFSHALTMRSNSAPGIA